MIFIYTDRVQWIPDKQVVAFQKNFSLKENVPDAHSHSEDGYHIKAGISRRISKPSIHLVLKLVLQPSLMMHNILC